jgi:hypothetical protein
MLEKIKSFIFGFIFGVLAILSFIFVGRRNSDTSVAEEGSSDRNNSDIRSGIVEQGKQFDRERERIDCERVRLEQERKSISNTRRTVSEIIADQKNRENKE